MAQVYLYLVCLMGKCFILQSHEEVCGGVNVSIGGILTHAQAIKSIRKLIYLGPALL